MNSNRLTELRSWAKSAEMRCYPELAGLLTEAADALSALTKEVEEARELAWWGLSRMDKWIDCALEHMPVEHVDRPTAEAIGASDQEFRKNHSPPEPARLSRAPADGVTDRD